MNPVTNRLHRLSSNQLRALLLLAQSSHGVISSTESGKKIGVSGKALGGVFSSLARQKINKKPLIVPWGKSNIGQGLRWKLNTDLISKGKLLKITNDLLKY